MATPSRFDMQVFATRVQERRRTLGWSQTELAKRADLDLGNINEVEHGRKSSVRADTLVSLAVALGVSTDYLVGLTDDPQSLRSPVPLSTPKRQRSRTVTPVT
jgi:transcriptional regulator with XRE-family HTH domain